MGMVTEVRMMTTEIRMAVTTEVRMVVTTEVRMVTTEVMVST
jgi:hypothetical protein